MNRRFFFWRRRSASSKRPVRTRLQVERLESRELLSANIDVSNDSHVQRETSIDVNPLNSQNLVAAATDESIGNTAYFSRDGGNTWKTSGLLPLKVEGTKFWFTSDPVVAFDSRGSVYVAYNAIDQAWPQPKGHGAIAVAKSTDGGESWTQVTAVEFNPNTDHPKISIDKDPASPYRDTVYVTWKHFFPIGPAGSSFDVLRSRSTDGGLSWSAPVDISDDPGQTWFNAAAVGPEGNVYASWIGAINPAGGATQFVDRSSDGGATFGSDLAVTTINTDDVGQGAAFSSPAEPNNFSGLSLVAAQASLDTDRSSSRFRGRVYLVYADRPDPTLRPSDMDIYLQFSDDQARTWSPRIRVNDDGAGNSQFFPSLSVDPADGTVVISWYDTRRDPANLQKTDVFLAVGTPTNHGVSFGPNLRVTDEQSDESTNNKQAEGTYGDYEGLVAFGGVGHPVWTDARVSNFPPQGSLREEVYTAAIQYAGGANVLGASLGHTSPGATLTSQQVDSQLPEAIHRWQAAGADTSAMRGIGSSSANISQIGLSLTKVSGQGADKSWFAINKFDFRTGVVAAAPAISQRASAIDLAPLASSLLSTGQPAMPAAPLSTPAVPSAPLASQSGVLPTSDTTSPVHVKATDAVFAVSHTAASDANAWLLAPLSFSSLDAM